MAWYMLFFQFEGIAEAWLQRDDWALFREMLLGNGDIDRYISDLSRPDALKASLNWYRANLAPRLPGPPPKLPPVEAPTLGIWSSNDHYLDGERMKMSGQFVKARWRYEQINDASHWIPLDAPDRLNQFLIEWLRWEWLGLKREKIGIMNMATINGKRLGTSRLWRLRHSASGVSVGGRRQPMHHSPRQ
jgi:pimeloyl-ACP methyl ester carboxylesterase